MATICQIPKINIDFVLPMCLALYSDYPSEPSQIPLYRVSLIFICIPITLPRKLRHETLVLNFHQTFHKRRVTHWSEERDFIKSCVLHFSSEKIVTIAIALFFNHKSWAVQPSGNTFLCNVYIYILCFWDCNPYDRFLMEGDIKNLKTCFNFWNNLSEVSFKEFRM